MMLFTYTNEGVELLGFECRDMGEIFITVDGVVHGLKIVLYRIFPNPVIA
jgi:hypothetical protein